MKLISINLSCFALLSGVILWPHVALAAALNETAAASLFREAQQLFREANELAATQPEKAQDRYAKAAVRFERIVQEGDIHNGRLFYNIGNAYFRRHDLGRAILYYRRAQRYIPNDANLQQNLAYARSKRIDKIEEVSEAQVRRQLFFWHYDLPVSVRSYVFASSFLLIWVSAVVLLFYHRKWLRWISAAAAVVAVLFLASLLLEHYHLQQNPAGVIISTEVVGRKGDSHTYESSFTEPLHEGAECVLLEKRGSWCHVELIDGRRTWIPATAVEMVF